MRKTVKLTIRRERALKRLELIVSGVKKSTKEIIKKSIGEYNSLVDDRVIKLWLDDNPYYHEENNRFYKDKDIERIKEEIETLKSRI